jgi:hypothetical protein
MSSSWHHVSFQQAPMALLTFSMLILDPNSHASKLKKGKKIVTKKEWQTCCSFLHISQDPKIGNGKKRNTFWDKVYEEYNKNKTPCGVEIWARSMQTKWEIIKHDVTKFCECYGSYTIIILGFSNYASCLDGYVWPHHIYILTKD